MTTKECRVNDLKSSFHVLVQAFMTDFKVEEFLYLKADVFFKNGRIPSIPPLKKGDLGGFLKLSKAKG